MRFKFQLTFWWICIILQLSCLFFAFAVIICKWNMYNTTSSVLSPEKRFMTLVCQVRYGDQVALGYTLTENSFWTSCFIEDLVWKSIEHTNRSTRQFPLVLLLTINIWKSAPIFQLATLDGQVVGVVWSAQIFVHPTAPSAKSSAWVLRHSSKACVTSQASVASCREMVAPYPHPSSRDNQIDSFSNWMNKEVNSLHIEKLIDHLGRWHSDSDRSFGKVTFCIAASDKRRNI